MPARLNTRPALEAFGLRVKAVRLAVGITQRELGRRSKVGYRFLSELERGKENPSLETIVLIAHGLNCDLADFFPNGQP